MYLTRQVLLYLRGLEESRMLLRVPRVILPFVIFAGAQCILLFSLTFFQVPPIASFMIPVVGALGGEQALHYPAHFVYLPTIYHDVYLPVSILLGFVLFGWAVFKMGDHYQKSGARIAASRRIAPAIPSMIVVGAIYVTAAIAMPTLFNLAAGMITFPMSEMVMGFAGIVASAVVQSFLVYSLLFLRTETTSPFTAIRKSAGFARSHLLATLMVILTVIAIHTPMDYLLSQPDKVVLRFRPELVFYLLLAGIAVEIITNYMLLSATTSIALSRRENVV